MIQVQLIFEMLSQKRRGPWSGRCLIWIGYILLRLYLFAQSPNLLEKRDTRNQHILMSEFSSFNSYIQQSHSTAKIHAFDVASGVHLANLFIVPHAPMISQPEILSFCCAIEKGKRTRSITMPCRKTKSHPQELKTNILGNGLYSTNQVFLTRHQLSLISEQHFLPLRNGRMLEHRQMWDTERIDSGAPESRDSSP